MLRLHTEFQCPTMPGTGLKVCGGGCGGWVVWYVPILVLSLGQAEQYTSCTRTSKDKAPIISE